MDGWVDVERLGSKKVTSEEASSEVESGVCGTKEGG